MSARHVSAVGSDVAAPFSAAGRPRSALVPPARLRHPVDVAETATLRRLAAEKGLLYGTTISAAQITGDPDFVELVLQQVGLVVAENEMKWLEMN